MPQANDIIEAIDAVTGDLKWQHRRDLPDELYDHVGANGAINPNIAIYDRFVINISDDVYVSRLDAEMGALAWETPIFDYTEISDLHSSGPIIAGGKLISGRSCGRPEACVIVAHASGRRGAVAQQDHSVPGGARRRDLGRGTVRGAPPRRHLDPPQGESARTSPIHAHVKYVDARAAIQRGKHVALRPVDGERTPPPAVFVGGRQFDRNHQRTVCIVRPQENTRDTVIAQTAAERQYVQATVETHLALGRLLAGRQSS